MSASFYDLLKYAKTGIASPSMTYYDKLRASTLMGGVVQTLTGIPPLSFPSDGSPITVWSMKGNGSQTGTPTPDNIIMPTFCGVRSAQLIPYPFYSSDGEYAGVQFTTDNGRIIANGTLTSGLLYYLWRPAKFPAGTYTMSVKGKHSGATIYFRDTTNNVSVAYIYGSQEGDRSVTFTVAEEISAMVYVNAGSGTVDFDCTIMLNAGSESMPFEPTNGYKIPITCAGQTVPVYLGQTQTVRRIKKLVLTGEGSVSVTSTGTAVIVLRISPVVGEECVCSHYIGTNDTTYSALGVGECTTSIVASDGGNRLAINDASLSTADAYKAFFAQQYAAGTPVTVWYVLAEPETGIVNEPLAKIGDYADELSSTIPIPTANGANTLTVDTTLQPSSLTITGYISQ